MDNSERPDHIATVESESSIPLSRVHHTERIERRVIEIIRSGNYILGPECKAFEQELAAYFGVKHVVLSANWTAAVPRSTSGQSAAR